MDNTRIEKKAVSVVNDLFLNRARKIDPNVEKGDKGISFDGNAIVFSSDEVTKASYLSSIPIQVKGTEVDSFSYKIAKFYKFDKDTFKNFQYEDGVVVFLVEILKENFLKTKVFFGFLDTKLLENILNDLNNRGKNTRVIELEELSPEMDLDKKFKEIAIQRKVYGLKESKIDSFLINGHSAESFSNSFEKSIVESASKNIEQYEYKNPNSQFNIKLKKKMIEILSHSIILDNLMLASIYVEIEKLNLLEVLFGENKNLALLIQARYKAMNNDFDSARAVLEYFDNSRSEWGKEYDRVLIESNYDNDEMESLVAKSILSNEEKMKYLADYKLENDKFSQFYELLIKNIAEDEEWQYLYGKYLLRLGRYAEAKENFCKANRNKNIIEIKFNELYARFLDVANEFFFGFQKRTERVNNELALLLDEIEVVRQKIEKVEYIEMPVLEKLHFESKILLDPKAGLNMVEGLLNTKKSDYDTLYLIEWKIKAIFLLDEIAMGLDYIENLSGNYVSNEVRMFKVLLFSKKLAYKDSLNYIIELFKTLEVSGNEKLFGFLTQLFLIAAKNCELVDENFFDSTIHDLTEKYTLELPLLFSLENTRRHRGNKKYGESFKLILDQFTSYPDPRKIQDAQIFLVANNELKLAEKMYAIIAAIDQLTADEILSVLYLYNGKIQESLEVINKYEDWNLSEKLIVVKAEAFNELSQFRATLQLYKNVRESNENFLNQVLIAKMNIHDKEEIESITTIGIESSNVNFKLNAAISLINYGIDISKGVQIIESYILKERFSNSRLNNIFLMTHLSNIKKIEGNKSIDLYNDTQLKWYKFKVGNELKEFVLVPKEWNIDGYENIIFKETDSEFELYVQGISINEIINFENRQYVLVEEKPLSLFIFHEILKRESGELGSDKPLISVELKLGEGNLGNLIDVVKKFDRSNQYIEVQKQYDKFHAPFIYGTVISEEDMIEFYLQIFSDNILKYFVGTESVYNLKLNYQISMSSISFMASLGLLDILKEYSNLFFEETQRLWMENMFSKELESTRAGRLGLANNNLFLSERTNEQNNDLKKLYRQMTLAARSLKTTSVGLIDPKLRLLSLFDESNVQSCINEKSILLCEDEALQILVHEEFNILASSVGMLISHYFLEVNKNIEEYLNILIRVIELKSAWKLQRKNLQEMMLLIEQQQNTTLKDKFNIWLEQYLNYFENN